jgi:hypothetical protein
MPIRLLAIDLDGTLLNSRGEVSEANGQALLAATERGVQLVVGTGRRFYSALPFIAQIPCPVTLISSNGALITNDAGEVLHWDFLPRQVARQVLEITCDYRPYSVLIFYTPNRGQVTMQDNAVLEGPLGWYLKTSADSLELVPELGAKLDRDPIQVMIGGPPGRIEPAEALLRSSPVNADVHLTWTKYLTRDVSILDIMNRGCSKGRALKFCAERCGILPSEVMAVGDNFNDLDMLQFAGIPVLMGNRCPGLDYPNWPTTLSNDEDGVAAAVRTYILAAGRG